MNATTNAVGLVGVGLLGTAIAERLLSAGFPVVGFDLRDERLAHLESLGGTTLPSALSVMQACETTVWSLPTSVDSQQVANELVANELVDGNRSTRIIDTTTGHPDEMTAIAAQLATEGIHYLDATVGGSSQDVRTGRGVITVGGSKEPFSECRHILECIAPQTFYLGESGSGSKMKLVVNLVLGLERAVLAEGLAFAESMGVDLEQALEVLKAGPAASRPMETKGLKMITRDFQPQARLDQHMKDVGIILELGQHTSAQLPLSQLHHQLLHKASSAGLGQLDNCSIIEVFRSS